MKTIDMFDSTQANRVAVLNGWFIEYSKASTAEYQHLVFDSPSAKSTYHGGQKSIWIINGVDKTVFYCDGDPERTPSKTTIETASDILLDLTEKGLLFNEARREKLITYTTPNHSSKNYIHDKWAEFHAMKVTGTCDAKQCEKPATTWFGLTSVAHCGNESCINELQHNFDQHCTEK